MTRPRRGGIAVDTRGERDNQTPPFFLRNRELASLVLDHLDHKTIGAFRLLCKQADACAKATFLRTTKCGYLSERSMRHTARVSLEIIGAKVANWRIITIADLPGLLAFAPLLGHTEVQPDSVETLAIRCRFLHQLPHEELQESAGSASAAGSWDVAPVEPAVSLGVLAARIKPRTLCLDTFQPGRWFEPIATRIPQWQLQTVAWHSMHRYTSFLVRGVPHHHVFCNDFKHFPPPLDIFGERATPFNLHPQGEADGLLTTTFQNRVNDFAFWDPVGELYLIRSDLVDHPKAASSGELVGPGGFRYIFPPRGVEQCPYCGKGEWKDIVDVTML